MGSLWMFLADLFLMGIIFIGIGLMIGYLLRQTVGPLKQNDSREQREFFPLLGKRQDSHISS